MKTKTLALIVCLVLVVFGLASATTEDLETVTTISLKTGALLSENTDVSQILDIAAIRIHSMANKYGAFALSLNDVDVLQSQFRVEPDGLYGQSPLLGQQPIYFAWEDLKAIIMEQLDGIEEMQSAEMPYDMGMIRDMLEGKLSVEQFYEMAGIDEELLSFMTDLEANQVVENGTFALNGSDTANTKTVSVITKDDICRAIDLPVFSEQISNQLLSSNPEMTQDEIDAQMAEIKDTIQNSNLILTSTMYTQDDEFIAMQYEMSAEMDDYNGATVPASILVSVTRTTIDTAKFYQLSVTLSNNGDDFINQYGSLYVDDTFVSGQYTFYTAPEEPALEVSLNCDRTQADETSGELSFTVYDSYYETVQSAFIMFDQQKDDNATDTTIDVYVGGTVDGIKAALADTSLISINIQTVKQPDSGFFAALQNASPDNSAQMLKMNEEELQTFMMTMQQSLTMGLLNLIENLPPDISEALMQQMGAM